MWRGIAAATAAMVALLTGCGSDDSPGGDPADRAGLAVVASFYPLQFVVDRVGTDLVDVANLTPPGAEPHDLELTPKDTASLHDADLVVYLAGFTPTLDDAVDGLGDDHTLDVARAARLDRTMSAGGAGEPGAEAVDPHFWLDPTRLADVADAVAARLGELDPAHTREFAANAAILRAELEALDGELTGGLTGCANLDMVTSHTAFGYLAARYGLTQVGISGLSPEEEPSPARLAEVADFVDDHDVSTIYFETLVDPAIAQTIAEETGATTAVLDPLEGLTTESAGSDYTSVMRANLSTLRTGQGCS